MIYIYRIGNVTIVANKCVLNGMAISADKEIQLAAFSDDTEIRVLKPGDVLRAKYKEREL